MAQKQIWTKDEVVELLKSSTRRLDILCPPLRSYLKPGMKVLDIGCGPGPVTLDVAAAVYPGEVVGVDFSPSSIAQARTAAEAAHCTNVTFQIGDTYALDFANQTFDVVYSLNVFVWLREPVQALAEQRRVTKPGGWVLTHLADYGNITFYPSCSTFDQYIAALSHLRDLGDSEAHIDSHQARRAIELLSGAGFSEIQMQGWVENVYQGQEGFDETYSAWREFWLSLDSPIANLNRKLIAAGLLNEEMISNARQELDDWYSHPYAFVTETQFLVTGRG